jgi:electron transport complex protein RnfD
MNLSIRNPSSRTIMLTAAACLVPGLVVEAVLFEATAVLASVTTALATAVATEFACVGVRGRSMALRSMDPSALVTALILAAALPPGAIAAVAGATAAALVLGKHVYGGLGNNVFNPAMVGYAVVLVSFPGAVAEWPLAAATPDALTGATPLTVFKYRGAATVEEIWQAANGFGLLGGLRWEWVSIAFLAGGLLLFALGMAAWRPCVGMLAALAVLALAGYDNGSSDSLGSPVYHLFSGATLLAACFVVTDPVTHPTGHRDQWLFGILVGTLTFVIRAWGNYPDGIAFAVLLANALAPWLNRRSSLQPESTHG